MELPEIPVQMVEHLPRLVIVHREDMAVRVLQEETEEAAVEMVNMLMRRLMLQEMVVLMVPTDMMEAKHPVPVELVKEQQRVRLESLPEHYMPEEAVELVKVSFNLVTLMFMLPELRAVPEEEVMVLVQVVQELQAAVQLIPVEVAEEAIPEVMPVPVDPVS